MTAPLPDDTVPVDCAIVITSPATTQDVPPAKPYEIIMFNVMVILVCIGVFVGLPVVMIVYGVQNNDVVCVAPCDGNCGSIQRNHVLHTPSLGISVSLALIISGIIYMAIALVCFICYFICYFKDKLPIYQFLLAIVALILFIWSCMCVNIVHSMTMQCREYNTAQNRDSATVVSMEPDLLLGISIPMLILSGFGVIYAMAYYRSLCMRF